MPGFPEPFEDPLVRERLEPDFVTHAFVEEADFPPVRFQPIRRPFVVQVVETEPVSQLHSQPKGVLEKLPRVQVLEPLPTATDFFGPQFFGERLAGGQVLSDPTAGGLGELRRRGVGLTRGGTLIVLGKLALDRDDEAVAVGYGYIKMWRSASEPCVESRFEVQCVPAFEINA